jgi:hypothetical protein
MSRDGAVTGLKNATGAVSGLNRTFVTNKGNSASAATSSASTDLSGAGTALAFINPALGAAVGLFGAVLGLFGGLFNS